MKLTVPGGGDTIKFGQFANTGQIASHLGSKQDTTFYFSIQDDPVQYWTSGNFIPTNKIKLNYLCPYQQQRYQLPHIWHNPHTFMQEVLQQI